MQVHTCVTQKENSLENMTRSKSFSSPEAAIHLASAMDRDLWPAPIFSPRFTDFRSFCAVSYLYQNGGPGNKFWTKIQNFSDITLKEKQYEVLKLLVVEEKDVLAVLPTGYGKSLIYFLQPPV